MSDNAPWRGHKRLRDWRAAQKLNQQEAADLIGIDLARYNAFENERARPGLDWAVKIEDVTRGDVAAKDWTVPASARARAS